jgi:hypothetical protein
MLGSLFAAQVPGQAPANPDPGERERQALADVERLGGDVYRDEKAPGNPVTNIAFYRPVSDADLGLARAFPQLRSLSLVNGEVTDAGLEHLAGLRQLEHLTLHRSPITDAGLSRLEALPRLRTIDLGDTNVTPAGVARLKESLPCALVRVRHEGQGDETGGLGGSLLVAALIALLGGGAALLLVERSRRPGCSRPWLYKLSVAAIAILIMGTGLLRLTPVMSPVAEDDPAGFWLQVTGLDVGVKEPYRSFGGFYEPRDGWFIYYAQGFHGQFLYRVQAADASALLPKVVEKLRRAPAGLLNPDVEQGFRDWARTGAAADDAAGFLAHVRAAQLARLLPMNPRLHDEIVSETEFDERWQRVGRYHWNVGFEFVFLAGLILFAAWPWIRGSGRVRWAVHLGLLPVLFCLPYWFGYAQFTFTSAGPSGGVLYPWLLAMLRGLPWTRLDTAIVRELPPVLEPLSQTPGPMLSLTNFGGPGPITAVGLGLAAGLAVFLADAMFRRLRAAPPRQLSARGG